jgi:hypothetical protein
MEVEAMGLDDGSKILDEFDSKLFILQKNVAEEVIKVI